jgi:antagonist of KipI
MDTFALGAANAIVGNALNAAGLEWALGGGSIRFDSDCVFALAGASTQSTLNGEPIAPFNTLDAREGEELTIAQFDSGRFLYVAFRGGVEAPIILHSRSTYLPGRFGGLDGRQLRHGDSLQLATPAGSAPATGFHVPGELTPAYTAGVVHITRGPQGDLFTDDAWRTLLEGEYRVSSASDRTGYRLEGPGVPHAVPALPSEAGCQGAIQVPGDGKPIVLMADAPTVGGYPKIAVVSEADLPILAQCEPGDTVRFELVTIEQSQRATRRRVSDLHTIRQLAETSLRRA